METALITGASEGIGLEFSRIFAQKKINLILIARNENRLRQISNELEKEGIRVKIIAKDLSKIENAISIYNEIKAQGIVIDYLINNAGYGISGEYANIPWEQEENMLNLNMLTLAYFTKVFVKEMKLRGKGRVLNVASMASFQPGPYMSGYFATKAFVLSLTQAIQHELKGSGVTATVLCPGATSTKFEERANALGTAFVKLSPHAKAHEVAKYGFKLMNKGRTLGVHGFSNKVAIFGNRLFTRNLMTAITGWLMKPKV